MFAAHFAAIMDEPTFIRKNLDACLKLATAANDHAAQQKIRAEISEKKISS
ncbi:hypothetical protein FACS1894107_14750 [Planctomycetales bacterium]|nr:hypothetical protein FACS1894107_14750 [Planctomycetales bacterium]GHS98565.1 hypothetical protein FACS1894108_06950 [Planctomycetales bacterium]